MKKSAKNSQKLLVLINSPQKIKEQKYTLLAIHPQLKEVREFSHYPDKLKLSIFSATFSPFSVNLYNLPFLTSGLTHSTSSWSLRLDNTFEI